MTAPLPKRAARRVEVNYDARLIASNGHEYLIVVKDLSAHGFRIHIDQEVRVGEKVLLRTGRGGDIPARIVWIMGSEAGGAFLTRSQAN